MTKKTPENDDDRPAEDAGFQQAFRRGLIRSPESSQRGKENVSKVIDRARVIAELRRTLERRGYQPVALATLVEELIHDASLRHHEVISALQLPEAEGLQELNRVTLVTVRVARCLGLNQDFFRAAMKLPLLSKENQYSLAPRQTAPSQGGLQQTLSVMEDRIREAEQQGGALLTASLKTCDAEITRLLGTETELFGNF